MPDVPPGHRAGSKRDGIIGRNREEIRRHDVSDVFISSVSASISLPVNGLQVWTASPDFCRASMAPTMRRSRDSGVDLPVRSHRSQRPTTACLALLYSFANHAQIAVDIGAV